uniref:Uncharacterized protein n=1 Tax=Astyanax mexicanus TaxID=7994 RepID=A0A3B1IH94_ASTMX
MQKLPYFVIAHSRALFKQDNAHPHAAALLRACLEDTDAMPWPVASPDLLLIKKVWDCAIGRAINTPTLSLKKIYRNSV